LIYGRSSVGKHSDRMKEFVDSRLGTYLIYSAETEIASAQGRTICIAPLL